MKLRHLPALLALAVPHVAHADGHKLLVLQSEGRADAATRAKIDATILKFAQKVEPSASAGELNYSDAATAVGCKPESPTCKDEVMAMLSVDEIVITNVTPKPGGLEVAVERVTKGGTSHDAKTMIPTGGSPDSIDGIAPLFAVKGATPRPPTPTPAPAEAPKPAPPPPPAITNTPPAPPAETPAPTPPPSGETEEPKPAAVPPPTSVTAEPAPPPMTTQSQVDQPSGTRHTLEIAGMATGGGMVVLSFILWGAASSTQGDIDQAPTKTKADLQALKDLESKADGYAAGGNVLFLGGLVVGGISTYLYIRDRRSSSSASAHLMPTVLDHGVALSFGGSL